MQGGSLAELQEAARGHVPWGLRVRSGAQVGLRIERLAQDYALGQGPSSTTRAGLRLALRHEECRKAKVVLSSSPSKYYFWDAIVLFRCIGKTVLEIKMFANRSVGMYDHDIRPTCEQGQTRVKFSVFVKIKGKPMA